MVEMPTPRHARRLRRLRVPPPLPDVALGAPWEGHQLRSHAGQRAGTHGGWTRTKRESLQLVAGPGPTSVLSSGEVLAGPAPATRLNRPQDSSEMLADDSVRFNLVAGLVPEKKGLPGKAEPVRCRSAPGPQAAKAKPKHSLGVSRRHSLDRELRAAHKAGAGDDAAAARSRRDATSQPKTLAEDSFLRGEAGQPDLRSTF